MESNEKKSEFLGINHGTASGQLRKMILLDLLGRFGLDTCFQCSEQISTVEELSIEHKKPWFNVSTALFWDLDNIAFSHLSCNSAAARRRNSEKTHCIHGHEFTKENTYGGDGYRKCVACTRRRDAGRKR